MSFALLLLGACEVEGLPSLQSSRPPSEVNPVPAPFLGDENPFSEDQYDKKDQEPVGGEDTIQNPDEDETAGVKRLQPGGGCSDLPVQPEDSVLNKVIAHWDVVPFQTVSTPFNIGVVAFFSGGVHRVEFSLNCGPIEVVALMEMNSRTGVKEYFVEFDPRTVPDGVVEIRAVAYPEGPGLPRVLPALKLNANAGGTLVEAVRYASGSGSDSLGNGSSAAPFRTIKKAVQSLKQAGQVEGATIFLGNGEYTFGTDNTADTFNRWLKIERDPLATARPIIRAASAEIVRTNLLHIKGVKILNTNMTVFIGDYHRTSEFLWLDDVELEGQSHLTGSSWHAQYTAVYLTRSTIKNYRDGFQGSCSKLNENGTACVEFTYVMQRDVLVDGIGSDALSNSALVINTTVKNILGGGDLHPDVYQFYGRKGDVILYGVRAEENLSAAQGLFAGYDISIEDVAFVDCVLDNSGDRPPNQWVGMVFQFMGPAKNWYVLNSHFRGPARLAGQGSGGTFFPQNVVYEDTTFVNPNQQPYFPGIELRNVQYQNP